MLDWIENRDDIFHSFHLKNERHQVVGHGDYHNYKGLDRKFVIHCRLRFLRSKRKNLEMRLRRWKSLLLKDYNWYCEDMIVELTNDINKINKEISIRLQQLRNPERELKSYDIERIKSIPLNEITEINNNGFFVNNPFRNERSPSNSLYWNKKNNRYHDFGTGMGGDVIDLYMTINNCDIKTALKELSSVS